MAIRLLTKATLCYVFGLYAKTSNRLYYHQLREYYFTEDVLAELGISEERYQAIRGKKSFNFLESRQIIEYFDIRNEELPPGTHSVVPVNTPLCQTA